jgi:hypothetical protein
MVGCNAAVARDGKQSGFQKLQGRQLLPKEILHPKIADPVWRAFMRGEFDVAAFQAMKAVEVSVRAASGLAPLVVFILINDIPVSSW